MTLFTETREFHDWLSEFAAMPSTPLAENLYADDAHGKIRLLNLQEYFRKMALLSPNLILIGEAPGYQGTRRTGVPFGSEHIITGGMPEARFFNNLHNFKRAYDERIYKEPTSTITWRTISEYEKLPPLWAVYPLHPHRLGNFESNRTPRRKEVETTKEHLLKLLRITGIKTVLALGNTAKNTLDDLNIPAQGGTPVFRRQLEEFMKI